ncbi:TPA: hypothetical protein ACH3X1_009553 [Trebouxia sp. C0004]
MESGIVIIIIVSACHNAHRFANTLYSCSQLEINPCDGRLVEYILQCLLKLSLAFISAPGMLQMQSMGLRSNAAGQHPASLIDKLDKQDDPTDEQLRGTSATPRR